MKLFLLKFAFIFCLSLNVLYAQPTDVISGNIVDEVTNVPLVGVNVFIENTTFGVATNDLGAFEINFNGLSQFKLVASFIGYETFKKEIYLPFTEHLTIQLSPQTFSLEGIAVSATMDREWQRNLTRLNKLLFNDTPFGKKCTFLNPELLELSYDEETEGIIAFASKPIVIVNPSLGYEIMIVDFKASGNEHTFQWEGETQFKPLVAKNMFQESRWRQNRKKAYLGSLRHFLTALYEGKLRENGFIAFHVRHPYNEPEREDVAFESARKYTAKFPPLVKKNDTDSIAIVSFDEALYVRFSKEDEPWDFHLQKNFSEGSLPSTELNTFQSSWITLPYGATIIDKQGHQYNDSTFFRYGFWWWERFGELLPDDYVPPESQ